MAIAVQIWIVGRPSSVALGQRRREASAFAEVVVRAALGLDDAVRPNGIVAITTPPYDPTGPCSASNSR
jgi:hypothetical protein